MIFRIYHETLGGHVHMRLFAGKRNSWRLGKCGDLTMRVEEFTAFQSLMQYSQIEFHPERREIERPTLAQPRTVIRG